MIIYDDAHILDADVTLLGLLETVRAAGIATDNRNGSVYVSDPPGAAAIATGYDPLPYVVTQQLAAAGDRWWAVRNRGHTTAAGIPLTTDDSSLALINGAYAAANANAEQTFNFRDATGTWRALSAADMQALFADVSAWIQSVFNNWQAIDNLINAATDWQAAAAVDVTANWPA